MAGPIYLGTLEGKDGQKYSAYASFERFGPNLLRVRVMEKMTGKLFPVDVLGSRKSLDCVIFRPILSKGWAEYLADDDTTGRNWAPMKKQEGERARLRYLQAEWLKNNEDPRKKNTVSAKATAGNTAARTTVSNMASSSRAMDAEDVSQFDTTSEDDETGYFDGTDIAISTKNIKKGCYREYDVHASTVIDLFLRGKLLPSPSRRMVGVSAADAIVSAFYKFGYRINLAHALDAYGDIKDNRLNSILESTKWRKESIVEEREIKPDNKVHRILQGESLEDINVEERNAMAEKKALKRKAAKMEDTEEAQIQAIPRVPRPATTTSVRC